MPRYRAWRWVSCRVPAVLEGRRSPRERRPAGRWRLQRGSTFFPTLRGCGSQGRWARCGLLGSRPWAWLPRVFPSLNPDRGRARPLGCCLLPPASGTLVLFRFQAGKQPPLPSPSSQRLCGLQETGTASVCGRECGPREEALPLGRHGLMLTFLRRRFPTLCCQKGAKMAPDSRLSGRCPWC